MTGIHCYEWFTWSSTVMCMIPFAYAYVHDTLCLCLFHLHTCFIGLIFLPDAYFFPMLGTIGSHSCPFSLNTYDELMWFILMVKILVQAFFWSVNKELPYSLKRKEHVNSLVFKFFYLVSRIFLILSDKGLNDPTAKQESQMREKILLIKK